MAKKFQIAVCVRMNREQKFTSFSKTWNVYNIIGKVGEWGSITFQWILFNPKSWLGFDSATLGVPYILYGGIYCWRSTRVQPKFQRANLVVRTARFFLRHWTVRRPTARTSWLHAYISLPSMRNQACEKISPIRRYSLRFWPRLYIPPSNLRGSKIQVVNN